MTIFSFHPVKTITTGEGGAIVTNDAELAHRLRMLRNHGMERDPARFVATDAIEDGRVKPWFHEQQMLGFNYRMTDLQAALGLSQLAKLDEFLRRRREIAAPLRRGVRRAPACPPAAVARRPIARVPRCISILRCSTSLRSERREPPSWRGSPRPASVARCTTFRSIAIRITRSATRSIRDVSGG